MSKTYYLVEIDGCAMEVWSSRPNADDSVAYAVDSCEAEDRTAAKAEFAARAADPDSGYWREGITVPVDW